MEITFRDFRLCCLFLLAVQRRFLLLPLVCSVVTALTLPISDFARRGGAARSARGIHRFSRNVVVLLLFVSLRCIGEDRGGVKCGDMQGCW